MLTKVCTKCSVEKPVSEFYKDKKCKLGVKPGCKSCVKGHKKENKEHYKKIYKKYRQKNKETIKNYQKEYRKKHYQENKEYYKEYYKKYRQENKGKYSAHTARRKATKLQATPKWLTPDHHKAMQEAYAYAKECEILTGDVYHVDHIVPLQGKTVCGLHVPWNLQVLPAEMNLSKNNTFDGGW